MSNLITINDEKIKVQDMFLDFQLTATSIETDKITDFTGAETFTINAYKEGQIFGITNIEIDVALNQQPQVDITFKDAYGNTALRTNNNPYQFRKLFELPPPKFTLTFKGYLGKAVTYILQLRSSSVTFQPNDGSFEIKAKFVPNIFGFYGDIPYKYLWSVDKLKSARNADTSGLTILQIAQNGVVFNQAVETASANYSKIEKQLNSLNSIGDIIYGDFNSGLFSSAVSAETGSNEARKIQPITSQDSKLTDAGFKPINFNIKYQNASGVAFTTPTSETTGTTWADRYGNSIKASIQTENNKDEINLKESGWFNKAESLLSGPKGIEISELITKNLEAIKTATQRAVGGSVQEAVIDSQTIKTVMSLLASDTAYILGYILEGGLKGYKNSPGRETNNELIGLYYPLTNVTSQENSNLYDQKPDPSASIEMSYVKDFMRAQFEGIQVVQKYVEEQQTKESGLEGAIQTGGLIKKRITNVEVAKSNPYAGQSNIDMFCVNILQRCGLMATRMTGALSNDAPKDYQIDYTNQRINLAVSEYENMSEYVKLMAGNEKEQLRKFCTVVTALYNPNGTLKKQYTDQFEGTTFQNYFARYFELMKNNGLDNKMFFDNRANSLYCHYFINNNVLYYSEKTLYNEFEKIVTGRKANNTLRGFSNGDLLMYIKPENKPTLQSGVTLNGGNADVTAPYKSGFFKFYVMNDDYVDYFPDETVFLDYAKMTEGNFKTPSDLIIRRSEDTDDGVPKFEEGSWFAFYANLNGASVANIKDYVLNLGDTTTGANLHWICSKILSDTGGAKPETDKKKAEDDKKKQQNDPDAVESPAKEQFTFDQNIYDAIYHQFHHICNSWMTIIIQTIGSRDAAMELADKKQLAEKLELLYKGSSAETEKENYNITYIYPLAKTLESDASFPVQDSIIKTELLQSEYNSETTVFNLMSQICQQNNFLLQSIPGGVPRTLESEQDLLNIFTPSLSTNPLGRNALCVIWQPTPESRAMDNSGNYLYDYEKFKAGLNNMKTKIPLFEFGSPNNIVVKSIKATTDDNKVTAESILAVEDIMNPQNPQKRKAVDCSMLSVMQGRSYRLNMDILGNANFIPTQFFAVGNMPIFTGLYWTSRVKHTITPNNMETNIEAIKMKFDGNSKFLGVEPITKRNFVAGSGGGAGAGTIGLGSGGEGFGSSSMNTGFLVKVKNVKLKNAADINALIKQFTGDPDFPTFFNTKVKGKYTLLGSPIAAQKWTEVWNYIIPVEWPDYGADGCNFLEFLMMNEIIYHETGGTYLPKPESINGVTNSQHPGIGYPFDSFLLKNGTKKASYNQKYSTSAFVLFNDNDFIAAHKLKLYGNDPKVLRSQDRRWEGDQFPYDLFSDKQQAVQYGTPTFINEADFNKFRGRGYIQTTWRSGYEKVLSKILSYTGNDNVVIRYRDKWRASPFNSDKKVILNRSSITDWDDLFNNSPTVCGWAMVLHASASSNYQYVPDLTKSSEFLYSRVFKAGKRVNGGDEYAKNRADEVCTILDVISPSTKSSGNSGVSVTDPNGYVPTGGINVGGKNISPLSDYLDWTQFSYPINCNKISSPVGNRIIKGREQYHLGVDLPAVVGTPFYSICDGVVSQIGATGGGDKAIYVKIDRKYIKKTDAPDFYIWYMHNETTTVSVGSNVTKGMLLGTSGERDAAGSPHLHIEFETSGKKIVLDPNKYFGTRNQLNNGGAPNLVAKTPFREVA